MVGKKLTIRDPGEGTRRKVSFLTKSSLIDTSPNAGLDPIGSGGSLHLYNTSGGGDATCLLLPAAGWSASGEPPLQKFRYVDKAGALGPCKVARVKPPNTLKVVCKSTVQPIDYSLDEPSQGSVAVRFTAGLATFCTEFGDNVKKDQVGRFVAVGAGSPVECPQPPDDCP